MNFATILSFASETGFAIIRSFSQIFGTFNYGFFLPGFGDTTIAEVMFGGGLVFFMIFTIGVWLVKIVP